MIDSLLSLVERETRRRSPGPYLIYKDEIPAEIRSIPVLESL